MRARFISSVLACVPFPIPDQCTRSCANADGALTSINALAAVRRDGFPQTSAIGFNGKRVAASRAAVISARLYSARFPVTSFLTAQFLPFPRVLLTAHYLQTNITRHIPNYPPSRNLPRAARRPAASSYRRGRGKIHIRCNIDIHIEIFPISSRVYRV